MTYKLPEPDLRRPDGVYWNEKQAHEIAKAAYAAGLAAREGWKMVSVDRDYDVRVKQLIAFNTCKGDLDDKLEAAHLAMIAAPEPTK